jgi:hypothetical protein
MSVGFRPLLLPENKKNMTQGRIQYLNEKPFGNKTLYSFKLFEDETLYMCGDKAIPAKKGDYVTFDATQNPKGQTIVNTRTLQVKQAEVQTARTGGFVKDTGKDDYWNKREARDLDTQKKIEWQASRNSAIAAANVILANGALKMPAKEAGKYEAVLALIDELTARFHAQTLNVLTDKAPDAAENREQMPTEVEASDDEAGWDE